MRAKTARRVEGVCEVARGAGFADAGDEVRDGIKHGERWSDAGFKQLDDGKGRGFVKACLQHGRCVCAVKTAQRRGFTRRLAIATEVGCNHFSDDLETEDRISRRQR